MRLDSVPAINKEQIIECFSVYKKSYKFWSKETKLNSLDTVRRKPLGSKERERDIAGLTLNCSVNARDTCNDCKLFRKFTMPIFFVIMQHLNSARRSLGNLMHDCGMRTGCQANEKTTLYILHLRSCSPYTQQIGRYIDK